MKVELDRRTSDGLRMVTLTANDSAKLPETIRAWIKMLQIAERWLQEGKRKDNP
ncbi:MULTISPECIES: hypothetical protein [unclassified Bradyrhizobium]|uniref:hypothetical protein n=1 Tax=unclassified Bradyrhizobium TaxID=2631580 RepID=UPI002FF19C6E